MWSEIDLAFRRHRRRYSSPGRWEILESHHEKHGQISKRIKHFTRCSLSGIPPNTHKSRSLLPWAGSSKRLQVITKAATFQYNISVCLRLHSPLPHNTRRILRCRNACASNISFVRRTAHLQRKKREELIYNISKSTNLATLMLQVEFDSAYLVVLQM